MVQLDPRDLRRLVEVLQQFLEFEDEKSRRSFLPMVGLGPLLPRMDLAGTPFIASMKIINFLGAYGRLPNGVEALGSLLAGIREYLGATEQRVIDDIMAKYQLSLPAALADARTAAPGWPADQAGAGAAPGWLDNSSQQTVPGRTGARKVLISSSSADHHWVEMLKTQLALLERQGVLELWDETRIAAGAREERALNEALNSASVALLLVSAHFLASEAIMQRELPRILALCAQGQLTLFPLILSPCLYRESPLGVHRPFNSVDQPLSRLASIQVEEVLVSLARALQRSV